MADILLKFKGKTYRVPDSRAFELGELVEDVVTLGQIPELVANPKFYRIARCYGVMLRFAGCKVSDREVHADMMAALKSGKPEAGRLAALSGLLAISCVLMDGAPPADGEDAPEKTEAS